MENGDYFNPKVHLALTWSGVPLIILFFIGMVPMSGFIPPSSPMESASDILAFYTSNLTMIRAGLVVSAISFTLMFGWGCAIAVWTYRIERGFPILTFTQLKLKSKETIRSLKLMDIDGLSLRKTDRSS